LKSPHASHTDLDSLSNAVWALWDGLRRKHLPPVAEPLDEDSRERALEHVNLALAAVVVGLDVAKMGMPLELRFSPGTRPLVSGQAFRDGGWRGGGGGGEGRLGEGGLLVALAA